MTHFWEDSAIPRIPETAIERLKAEVFVERLIESAGAALNADDQALLNQVMGYYHETWKLSPEALDYLKRGLDHPKLIDHFQLGYANRSLGLPEKNRAIK